MTEVSPLRQAVDPEGTLPSVELRPDLEATTPTSEHYQIYAEAAHIGYIALGNHESGDAQINDVFIEADMQGQGYGMASYLAAAEKGHGLRSSEFGFSKEAADVWQRFIDAGVAEVVEPIQQMEMMPPIDLTGNSEPASGVESVPHYSGDIRIRPQ